MWMNVFIGTNNMLKIAKLLPQEKRHQHGFNVNAVKFGFIYIASTSRHRNMTHGFVCPVKKLKMFQKVGHSSPVPDKPVPVRIKRLFL